MSHHSKQLHQAGLVAREPRGSWVYYRLVLERVGALRGALEVPNAAPGAAARRRVGTAAVA